ncbi:hypothetical protein BKN38_05080 [Helicobacter sp. CLO-3]|uniref:SDR family NAD(P)-dependent oxidoreductase n=1 Tax=unclassified Helicobacter TaxID=2593540 RepID=UPI0008049C5A|nr:MULTISPECIES: SDR family NAD(P)-dependent oxidoreductase [unclassified Helicobacter]OBV29894.1 hypothetical protein BA723_03845 [Helicobacter sp. CLO-3]OHU83698.1 hypothetical protein BKN38_05080 [Helicobacter sp. CLO-3]
MSIAVVSGASSGLGVCFARAVVALRAGALAGQGGGLLAGIDEIWLIARNQGKLESLQKEILDLQSAESKAESNSEAKASGLDSSSLSESKSESESKGAQDSTNLDSSGACNSARSTQGSTKSAMSATSGTNPLKCRIFALDLTDLASFDTLESALKSQSAQISLLISNAGVARYGRFADSSLQDMLDIVRVNIIASSALTRVCLPFMMRGGKIIEVSSVASFAPNVNLLVYSASKAYVSAFSLGLNEELKERGIGVCALCPGLMQTGMTPDLGQTREGARKLPELDPQKVATGAIKAALRGKTLYTPSAFYKLYWLLTRILPRALIIKLARM